MDCSDHLVEFFLGIIFGQTANQRGGVRFQGESRFFSYGVIQGAVHQNMELILHRFESKVVKAVDAPSSISWYNWGLVSATLYVQVVAANS